MRRVVPRSVPPDFVSGVSWRYRIRKSAWRERYMPKHSLFRG